VQLLPENFEETSALFKILMGNNSTERKKFIMANALKYRLMDEDIYDVEEGEE
jgi:DNA gyrase/topoisomerase IV subunit B